MDVRRGNPRGAAGLAAALLLSLVVGVVGGCTQSLYVQGHAQLQRGDYPGALDTLSRALAQDPTDIGALLERAVAYENMDLVDEALQDCDRAVELDATVAAAWYQRGRLLARKGDHERAVAAYDQAVEFEDVVFRDLRMQAITFDAARLYFDRGVSLYRVERFDLAIDSFDRAIVRSPRFASAFNSRGIVHARIGDRDAACADRATACELGMKAACAWAAANCP